MDRESAIAYLQSKGIDPASITDDVPDAFLIVVAEAWQKEEGDEGEQTGADAGAGFKPPANKPQMADTPRPRLLKRRTVTQQFSHDDVANFRQQQEAHYKIALERAERRQGRKPGA